MEDDEIYLNYTMTWMHITSINFYTFTFKRDDEDRNSHRNQLKNQMDMKLTRKCKFEEGISTACEHTHTHTINMFRCVASFLR